MRSDLSATPTCAAMRGEQRINAIRHRQRDNRRAGAPNRPACVFSWKHSMVQMQVKVLDRLPRRGIVLLIGGGLQTQHASTSCATWCAAYTVHSQQSFNPTGPQYGAQILPWISKPATSPSAVKPPHMTVVLSVGRGLVSNACAPFHVCSCKGMCHMCTCGVVSCLCTRV